MGKKRGFGLGFVIFILSITSAFAASSFNISSSADIYPGVRIIAESFDGSTTDFDILDQDQQQAISDIVLENTSYGKISFSGTINLTIDAVNRVVDLDSNVEISSNRISIDTGVLTSLERNATLSIYGITYWVPEVYRNGALCPASICRLTSYSDNILTFNVQYFGDAYYTVHEGFVPYTPPAPTPVLPPASSGPSSTPSYSPVGSYESVLGQFSKPVISFDKDLIKLDVRQGETKRDFVEIANIGTREASFSLNQSDIGRFLVLSEDSFVVQPGQKKRIEIAFTTKGDEAPEVHTGFITVNYGSNEKKKISFIAEVSERNPLFDVSVNSIEDVSYLGQDKIKLNIRVLNKGDKYDIDVVLYYALRDFSDKNYSFKQESIAIGNELNLVRILDIPPNIEIGKYLVYVKASYNNISAVGSDSIEVMSLQSPQRVLFRWHWWWIIVILAILITLRIIYQRVKGYRRRKLKEAMAKISQLAEVKAADSAPVKASEQPKKTEDKLTETKTEDKKEDLKTVEKTKNSEPEKKPEEKPKA